MNTINVPAQLNRVRLLRYAALTVVIINVIFNLLSITLFSHPSVEEVIYSYPVLFAPSGYSISIWIVHALFIAYTISQITPDKQYKQGLDNLAMPLIITNVFELGWQYAFVQGQLKVGMLFLIGMVISACTLYISAQKHMEHHAHGTWWRIPFNLYLAWTSVIAISATSTWLLSINWSIEGMTETTWTIVMILASGVLATIISFGRQDVIFPLVISWSLISLAIKYGQSSSSITFAALAIGFFLIWCALISLIQTSRSAESISHNSI